jgi:alkanesulfonate monooxygenase SsuD/methylene tetrahydromethanopterin reductase-like flavin-dependent oxidoreductase (luciferase family)
VAIVQSTASPGGAVRVGIHLSDVPSSIPPQQQFSDILRLVEAGQRNGFSYFCLGQHFLYGELRWLQPIPLLARLAAEVDAHVRLLTNIVIGPLYHPVLLAEEFATLDVVTEGRLVVGLGLGYRPDEFVATGIPHKERAARLDEIIGLMKRLWTEDEVTHRGRFWQLKAVRPHIRPVQRPHPPIWVGGVAVAGARRAGRLADAYLINPEAEPDDIRDRLLVVQEELARRGRAMPPQPLRRNVMLGADPDDAARRYATVAQDRYQAYAGTGLPIYDKADLDRTFVDMVKRHALLGTAEQIVEQVQALAGRFPIDPLLLRPQWPASTTDEAIAMVEALGRDVVPALRHLTPAQSVR